ncbi:MAG: acyltransferase, partial [Promethearchaeota archaeon]
MSMNKDNPYSLISNEDYQHFSDSIFTLRVFAFVIIIIAHSVFVNIFYFLYLGSFGNALFSFLSGILLMVSMVNRRSLKISWKEWYKKRAIRIYPSLIISTLIFVLVQFIYYRLVYEMNFILIHMSGLQSLPINSPELILIIAGPHWYITALICCYLMFPIFYYFIKKNYKFALFIGLFLYIFFISFSNIFYLGLGDITHFILQKEMHEIVKAFFPQFFFFYFGMILGYWIGKDNFKNLKIILNSRKVEFISFFLFITSFLLLFISWYFNRMIFSDTFYGSIFNPIAALSLIIFILNFLNKKTSFNKFFKIPGEESYEVYLLHGISLTLVNTSYPFLQNNFILYIFNLILVIIISINIAYPVYYFSNWIKRNRKYHSTIIIISLSLILYAIVFYIFNLSEINIIHSIMLYLSFMSCLIIFFFIKRIINSKRPFKFKNLKVRSNS